MDCKSLHDAVHKDSAAPSSTDKRLATVKSRAAEGEADLRWIDARYQIADTKHASRKSEEVLQQVINQAQWADHRRGNDAGNTTG